MLNDPLLFASPAGSRHRAGEVGQPRTSSRPRRSGLLPTRARIERTVVAVWAVGMLLLIGLRGFGS